MCAPMFIYVNREKSTFGIDLKRKSIYAITHELNQFTPFLLSDLQQKGQFFSVFICCIPIEWVWSFRRPFTHVSYHLRDGSLFRLWKDAFASVLEMENWKFLYMHMISVSHSNEYYILNIATCVISFLLMKRHWTWICE